MQAATPSFVHIDLGERSYPIAIGVDLLLDPSQFAGLPKASAVLIVSNTTVAPLYAERLQVALSSHYKTIHLVELPDGEEYKDWQTLNLIFDALLQHGCDRKTVLFALGGGVVGDMTGFAAASYMRGVPFVQVPTTLLAQVDSSVGGKTAINHPLGKNMIGAFYQPQRVVCDLATLDTLALPELSAGLAEIIKYGPIADMAFMDWLEEHIEALLARDRTALAYAVQRSCEIKAWVVGQDERESGLRAILNFGHTFGHAIEAGMGYGAWLHGEGVGAGMVMAAELSQRLGLVESSFVKRLTALIKCAGLPVRGPILDAANNAGKYLELMRVDKKTEGGELRFVLIDGPGKAVVRTAPDALVREVIDVCCEHSECSKYTGEINDAIVVEDTVRWLERAVIDLNLCPFAKGVHTKNQIHYAVSAATDGRELLQDLQNELEALAEASPEKRDTSLLMVPHCMGNFLDFNDFLELADELLDALDLGGILQIASFHPEFQFEGTEANDITNTTNRAPYPTLHLIREESLDAAVNAFPEAEMIYERNMDTLRDLGHAGWQALDVGARCPMHHTTTPKGEDKGRA